MDEGKSGKQPDRVGERMVSILVPTYNNLTLLYRMANSVLQYTAVNPDQPFYHVVVVNNGDPESVKRGSDDMANNAFITILDTGQNLGWEGGLDAGMEWVEEHTKSKYILFANDDIQILPNDLTWIHKMIDVMEKDERVGAVGPISNFVSAAQNFSQMLDPLVYETGMLIGFCLLVRASALKEVGGIVLGLPGGDDHDLSIRLTKAGYKLAIHGGVYVHHWGEATGKRVQKEYWNSLEMISTTRNELIRRHGLKDYLKMLRFVVTPLLPADPPAQA